ncbi:hypothetical protein LF1_35080 [Rubripirellula obstinata]|uniref:Uncharacterized protein n=1 Tax=Rubripirellula obstinata TaxID=406547 RepID=A0A5B1CK71_9BACT|nr:hypothetical protein LF1_35080 [Rubripirellula obstinata]
MQVNAVKSFGPGKRGLVRLAALGIAPRVVLAPTTRATARGAMPTRLNNLETLHGVGCRSRHMVTNDDKYGLVSKPDPARL